MADGLPYAVIDGKALVLLPADNLQWTEVFANRIASLEKMKGSVWVLGMPSATTTAQLTEHGWMLVSTENNEALKALYTKAS